MGLERAKKTVRQHKNALANADTRLSGQSTVDFGHYTRQLLVADKDGANRILMIVEGVVKTPHIAALNSEHHVDPGFFQDPRDPFASECIFRQQLLFIRHNISSPERPVSVAVKFIKRIGEARAASRQLK